ncbi:MAG: ribosome biogenesis GTP-binding protein YihA/YsxC [Pseudomonadota bacterium]|nr:YihA family ribosome biogenesis GTP-binding protein [Gammaproteobacteria bacterium]MEE2684538.1 ribosome biogenesis GTP-binding protein YihA/YsxC [Pseudomonadota bacterium]|tara:strand:+ start:4057 stop:4650 length:594 start_codon:yes stop_codon:yes gene_type:complete
MPFSQNSDFMLSAKNIKQFPNDSGIEIAFVGRSNSGKSSAINAILNRRKLAKTSKMPGRTQLVNFFSVRDIDHRIVDLPGYGYAKVSNEIKSDWERMVESYLHSRTSLAGLFITVDSRRGLNDLDKMMLSWTESSSMPTIVLLTKADKISKNLYRQLKSTVDISLPVLSSSLLFSSISGEGVLEAQTQLSNWFSINL